MLRRTFENGVLVGEDTVDDSAGAAARNLAERASAQVLVDETAAREKVLRAAADVIRDEINLLRQWLALFKTEVAAATSLADLKTRVAGLPNTPDRSLAQFRTAIINRINDGSVD